MVETTEMMHARLEAVHAELARVKGELAEREQELGCMYAALKSGDLGSDDALLEAVLQRIVDLVSLAFLEERVAARIVVTNQQFVTKGFCETPFLYTQSIMVDGREAGVIEVQRNSNTSDVAPLSQSKERFLASLAMRIGEVVRMHVSADHLRETDEALRATKEELADVQRFVELYRESIERQRQNMNELAAPVLEVWRGVLVVPIVGVLDDERGLEILKKVLIGITEKQPQFVIIDITGVPIVDTGSVGRLADIARAASLLGTKCVWTGIQPNNARTMVELGIWLQDVDTYRTLRDGLQACMRKIRAA